MTYFSNDVAGEVHIRRILDRGGAAQFPGFFRIDALAMSLPDVKPVFLQAKLDDGVLVQKCHYRFLKAAPCERRVSCTTVSFAYEC